MNDIITACNCGFDVLLVYLRMIGYSYREIARETGSTVYEIYNRLQDIYCNASETAV